MLSLKDLWETLFFASLFAFQINLRLYSFVCPFDHEIRVRNEWYGVAIFSYSLTALISSHPNWASLSQPFLLLLRNVGPSPPLMASGIPYPYMRIRFFLWWVSMVIMVVRESWRCVIYIEQDLVYIPFLLLRWCGLCRVLERIHR